MASLTQARMESWTPPVLQAKPPDQHNKNLQNSPNPPASQTDCGISGLDFYGLHPCAPLCLKHLGPIWPGSSCSKTMPPALSCFACFACFAVLALLALLAWFALIALLGLRAWLPLLALLTLPALLACVVCCCLALLCFALLCFALFFFALRCFAQFA